MNSTTPSPPPNAHTTDDTPIEFDTTSPPLPSHYSHESVIGDTMSSNKPPDTTRVYFVNINGLRYEPKSSGGFSEACDTMTTSHIDILGLAETRLDTHYRDVLSTCIRAARRTFSHSRVCLGSSPITYDRPYKPGGTALVSGGGIVGRIIDTFIDPIGRWCTTTYASSHASPITVISAYQVCDSPSDRDLTQPNARARSTAAIAQQQAVIHQEDPTSTCHPRTKFRSDILKHILSLQQRNHEILLLGDFNEVLGSDQDGMQHIASECALLDLFQHRLGHQHFGTYTGGTTRIDYALGTARFVTALRHCGYETSGYRFPGSDHRGFFLDFTTSKLFGNCTPKLATPVSRHVNSRDVSNCIQFVNAKHKYLKDHRWFDRLAELTSSDQPNHAAAEAIDRDWTRASIHAEKQCTRKPDTPFTIELAAKRRRKNALRIVIRSMKWRMPMSRARNRAFALTGELIPLTLAECELEYKQILKSISELERTAVTQRRTEQQALLAARQQAGDKAGAKALRNIIVSEETREMWRQLRALDQTTDSGITSVEVPADGNFDGNNCKRCTEWKTLTDPAEIEKALICRNRLHFGQAQGTFPTIPPFSEQVNWEASTPTADAILNGEIPFDDDDLSGTDLEMLQHMKATTALDAIDTPLTVAEWTSAMRVWNEATTTSPSGMHLGHHKALIREFPSPPDAPTPAAETKREDLLQAQVDLINYAITHTYCFDRWRKVAKFMIRKDPTNGKVHRLRVIHLYEADLNLLLGVKWRQLTHHCIDNNLLNDGQFGGLPGRDAISPVFLEELQWETARASRRSLLRTDFDATSCYDRIIPNLASLAARSFGHHRTLCIIHARFLKDAKYILRTKLGLSEEDYSHCQLYPIYGTGQGSRNSPVIWVLISSRLFDAHAAAAHGATFYSPDRSLQLRVFIIGFVDDVNACINDFENPIQNYQTILQRAVFDAQRWNDLLYSSGGALEIPKCLFHLAHYDFTMTGAPFLCPLTQAEAALPVRDSNTNATINLQYLPPAKARKTLGCYKSPSGNQKCAIDDVTTKAMAAANTVYNSRLDAKCTNRFYYCVFLPRITYSFPTNSMTQRDLDTIQNRSMRLIIGHLGYARTTPHAILYGPRRYGGANLRPLYDEQGSSQMALILKHLRTPGMLSTQLRIALSWCQRMAGTSTPIFSDPATPLPHLETRYFTSIRTYLADTHSSLVLQEPHITPLQRVGDFHLMDSVLASNLFQPKQIRMINYCRLYLQVHTISDIAIAKGTHINPEFLTGLPGPHASISKDLEIRQDRPQSLEPWTQWKRACSLWCNLHTYRLTHPLGAWLFDGNNLRRSWPHYWDKTSRRLYVRSPDGYTVHRFHHRFRCVLPQPITTVTVLPTSSVPVTVRQRFFGYQLTRCPILQPPRPAAPAATFEDFLQTQPAWIRSLLSDLYPYTPYHLLLDTLHAQPSIGVTDGSVLDAQGSFGWVLASTTTKEPLVENAGPAYGASMDSYRAEAYGQLSLVVFLHLLATYFDRPLPEITLLCDNKAVVDTVNTLTARKRPDFPNDSLRPSWDVLQSLRHHYKLHPSLCLGHILGHQDKNKPFEQLPFGAQLNVRADELAGDFQTASTHATLQGPMIDGTHCHLLIRGQVVASHQQKRLRDVRRTDAIRSYIQTKTEMTDAIFATVDWPSHELAVNSSPLPQPFLVKFLHRWLPVGKQIHRYDNTKYNNHCPSCPENVENFDHFLTCPNRRQWHRKLRIAVQQCMTKQNSDPTLADLLIDGLYHYLRSANPPVPPAQRFEGLVEQQTSIGWPQLLLGRWSTEWTAQQLHYLNTNGIPLTPHNHGPTWVRTILHTIWSHCHDEWNTRNKALHGHDAATRRQARLDKAQYRVRALYQFKPQCNPLQRSKWFYPSPEIHFAREPQAHQLENWITLNENRIFAQYDVHTHLQNTHQQTIPDFFPTLPPATNTAPPLPHP